MKRSWRWLGGGWAYALSLVTGCGQATGATTSDAPTAGSASGVAGGGAASGQAGAGGVTDAAGGGAPSSSGGESAQGSSGDAAGGALNSDACAAADLDGLSVFSSGRWDPLGYPPYALEGCTLVYVAPADGGGALHLRNLASGDDRELEPAASKPRRPTVAGDVIAWEIGEDVTSQVRVSYRGTTQTLSGDFNHTGEPRATTDAVVLTAFLGPNPTDDSDVYLYDVATEQLSKVVSGPGQQRFADVSPTHVVATDFAEDPRGFFDETNSIADVVIFDRKSGVATPRKRLGKQAFPLLGSDGALVYLDWGAVHPEPKFSQFGLRAGVLDASVDDDYDIKLEVHTDPAYVRPSLRGQHLDFVDTQAGVVGLYRFTLGSAGSPVATPVVGSPQLFGPVATDAMTLVSRPVAGETLALTAIAR